LRTELTRGDLRVAYLAWLLSVQAGEVADTDVEPPVPPGLSELTAAQAAMVEFLRIDGDLIAAAAEGSEHDPDDRPALRKWVLALVPRAKDEWLGRAIDDPELALGSELLRAFRAEAKPARDAGRRKVADLLASAEEHRERRQRAEIERAAKAQRAAQAAKRKRLDALSTRLDAAWTELEALIDNKDYDTAMKLAIELRDLARRDGSAARFAKPFEAMRKRQLRRRGFFDRCKRESEPERWSG
jgi:hypothetical protein